MFWVTCKMIWMCGAYMFMLMYLFVFAWVCVCLCESDVSICVRIWQRVNECKRGREWVSDRDETTDEQNEKLISTRLDSHERLLIDIWFIYCFGIILLFVYWQIAIEPNWFHYLHTPENISSAIHSTFVRVCVFCDARFIESRCLIYRK